MSGARALFQRDVTALLEHPDGVQAFRAWLSLDPARPVDALDLYLAIRGLSLLRERHDPHTLRTACHIHRKYISLRTGTCNFLSNDVRTEMSTRIHALPIHSPTVPPPQPPADLFQRVQEPLVRHLAHLHAQFAATKGFHDFVHAISASNTEEPSLDSDEPGSSKGSSPRELPIDVEEIGLSEDPPALPVHRHFTFNTTKRKRTKLSVPVEPTPFRHDRADGRLHFAAILSEKLGALRITVDRIDSVSGSPTEPTTSDEEVSRYADRMNEKRRSSSCSPPSRPTNAAFPDLLRSNGFAPPPIQTTLPNRGRFDLTTPRRSQPRKHELPPSDSSGFCSAESAFCDRSIDRKAQEFPLSPFNRRDRSRDARRFTFGTIPRPQKIARETPLLTVTLREATNHAIPLVARVPASPTLTFKEFRKLFGVRKEGRSRLFFKAPCDDCSAPFQWNLLYDDGEAVPIFGGQVFAESRQCPSDDSE
ncbi:unnamed protein product, partial [Mesorhabditis spiculigera]